MFDRWMGAVLTLLRKGFGAFPRKLLAGLVVGLISAGLLAGCWDKRELEELGFVLAMGVDAGQDGQILLTAQIAVPAKLGGGGGGGGGGGAGGGSQGPPVLVKTVSGRTILDAIDRFQATSDRRLSFLHNKMVIFGNDLAKKGLENHVHLLTRWREMRRSMFVLVSNGKAADILKIQPQQEANPSNYLENLVREDNRMGRIPFIQVNDFVQGLETRGMEAVAPIIRVEKGGERSGNPGPGGRGDEGGATEAPARAANLGGLAVFRKDRLVGELNEEETRGYMMITGRLRRGILVVPNPFEPDKWISLLIREAYRRVRVKDLGDPPRFEVRLVLDVDYGEIEGVSRLMGVKSLQRVERVAAGLVREEAVQAIRKTQQDYGSDIFGFGEMVREKLSPNRWEKFHWPDVYPQVSIDVSAKVNLRRLGMMVEPIRPR
ncbi:MAG: Ger(x)C family spore germination protein [Firmicutes bacterium]|nr:Ger(x)C family spore germination protein [Bacillota bacterium]